MIVEPAHVLQIGRDAVSRHDQVEVMRHFWMVAAAGPSDYSALLDSTDAIVLCQSLREEERHSIVESVKQSHPGLLVVKINGYDSGPHAGLDASVDLHHGPGALISTIYELFKERGIPSKTWHSEQLLASSTVV